MAAPTTTIGLSMGGKVFFGSLCVGTFGLGCWQIQRLVEKIDKVDQRTRELAMDPMILTASTSTTTSTSTNSSDWKSMEHPYRRRKLQGVFRHDKEVLIGPRGAPMGVSLPRKGLSSGRSSSTSGMSSGPQGYHVLTPLQLVDETNTTNNSKDTLVWINRGWVPKTMVPGAEHGSRGGRARSSLPQPQQNDLSMNQWSRPNGMVNVTAVRSTPEKPRMIVIEHDYSKKPLQLFWMDSLALQAIAESKDETILLTEVLENDTDDTAKSTYPLKPPVESVADFKTTPIIHAGYATTWFGLSAAGMYMTRKLITRGRG